MDYRSLFDAVRRHVEAQGVACSVTAYAPPTPAKLAKAEREMGVRLPAELREFYRAAGDFFYLSWKADADDLNQPFAGFQVPSLADLVGHYLDWRSYALYTPERSEEYGFPHAKDPALAKRTAARMWHWLPVMTDAGGDQICIDLGDPSCPVVFDQHDWWEGGNGHVLASNWAAFVAGWGSVCFQEPRRSYWPLCFREGGGVAWDGDEFREPFRLSGRG